MTNNYSQPNLSFLNPIYNISQLIQLTKYFSHPSIYPALHSKQISFNYIITSNNQFYPKHHQQINQLLHSQPISNNNFSAPPLTPAAPNPTPEAPQTTSSDTSPIPS